MGARITYQFRKANLLEYWDGNNIISELPVDPSPENVGEFIRRVGLDSFLKAVNEHGIEVAGALVPVSFSKYGSPYVDEYGSSRYFCNFDDLSQGLLAVPEIKKKAKELMDQLKQRNEESAAMAKEESKKQAAAQAKAREMAAKLLEGAQFSHIDEDGEIVFISKEGKEVLIGSSHSVWSYGDESGDSVTVACGSDVLYLTEFEGE